MLASVSLKNRDIYKNVAFISNPTISLKLLIKGTVDSRTDYAVGQGSTDSSGRKTVRYDQSGMLRFQGDDCTR